MRFGSILVVAALLWALPARAQSADAEVLFRAGWDLMEQERYAEACVKFEAAEQLERTLSTLVKTQRLAESPVGASRLDQPGRE